MSTPAPCQRWRDGKGSFRVGDPSTRIDTSRYTVARVEHAAAKGLVCKHHYARTWPSVSRAYGLYESRGPVWSPELVGVCSFGIPAGPAVLRAHGADLELNRLVLLDSVLGNAESWFVSQVFDDLARDLLIPPLRRPWALIGTLAQPSPGDALARRVAALLSPPSAFTEPTPQGVLSALGITPTTEAYQGVTLALTSLGYRPTRDTSLRILSFSDPLMRTAKDGRVITPGHVGIVYQALSAEYKGRTKPRRVLIDDDGCTLAERALSKIRNEESGYEGAIEALVERGAPARTPSESPASWLGRALQSPAFRVLAHPGQHTYHWTWSGRSLRPDRVAGLTYPKQHGYSKDSEPCTQPSQP
jgi:hypothetical protein